MKFKLLTRNIWGGTDVWTGKKKNYKVEIETPFVKKDPEFGKYSFKITTPYGTIFNTIKSGQSFDSLEECMEYVERWIDEDVLVKKAESPVNG